MSDTADTICESTTDRNRRPQQRMADSEDVCLRICLLGADYENSNLGIRALTTGVLTAIGAQFRHADIKIVDYHTAPRHYVFDLPGKAVPVELLNIRFSKKPWVVNHIARLIATALLLALVPLRPIRKILLSHNPWLQALVQADYVFSLNYGDSFSDIYGMRRFLYVSLPQVLAIVLRKPVVQLPQTIGPFRSRLCRAIAKWILSRSASIYTRDEQAVATIRNLVPASHAGRVRFCHDLGFVVPPKSFTCLDPPLDRMFSRRPVVGFNVSGLLWMGGYSRDNMFGLAADYKVLVRKAIVDLIEGRGATVLLIPHVLSPVGEGDPSVCTELFRELQSLYPDRIFAMRPPYDEREIKHVIGRCDFFVGARMHACIAALSQCVPAVALAYSDKFIGVLRSVGMTSTVADMRTLSTDGVLAVIRSSFDSRESLRSVLQKYIPAAQQTVFDVMPDCNFDAQESRTHANAGR